jgi:hypothetical protein
MESFREATLFRRPRQITEREILRISATLDGPDFITSAKAARDQVIKWANNKTSGRLPAAAFDHQTFEHLSSGRSASAVRIQEPDSDVWSLRVEDPDKTVAARVWTTEITIINRNNNFSHFGLRLTAGFTEESLDIEPHVPGVVRQIISSPGLFSGTFRLQDIPIQIPDAKYANLLMAALLSPDRRLPIIILSVPPGAADRFGTPIDSLALAKACAGLAIVVVLPSEFCWSLTERFGRRLSVYNGAARVYLPGFTEDANPFGGHELIFPEQLTSEAGSRAALTKLRWISAIGSIRRLELGKDVFAFASIKSQSLQKRQLELQGAGRTTQEKLAASEARGKILEEQLKESELYQLQFSLLHEEAESRAAEAEAQARANAFRIQQLLEQIKTTGATPDDKIILPSEWNEFGIWCDTNLAGRVILSPQARRALRAPEFADVALAARACY